MHRLGECSKVSQQRAGYISIVNHPSAGVSGSAVRGHALRGWWCGHTYSSFLFICSLHSGSGLVPQTCRVTNLTKTTIETISHRERRDRDHGLLSTLFEVIWKHDEEKQHLQSNNPFTGMNPCDFFFMVLKSYFQRLLHYIPSLCHLLYIRTYSFSWLNIFIFICSFSCKDVKTLFTEQLLCFVLCIWIYFTMVMRNILWGKKYHVFCLL